MAAAPLVVVQPLPAAIVQHVAAVPFFGANIPATEDTPMAVIPVIPTTPIIAAPVMASAPLVAVQSPSAAVPVVHPVHTATPLYQVLNSYIGADKDVVANDVTEVGDEVDDEEDDEIDLRISDDDDEEARRSEVDDDANIHEAYGASDDIDEQNDEKRTGCS